MPCLQTVINKRRSKEAALLIGTSCCPYSAQDEFISSAGQWVALVIVPRQSCRINDINRILLED